MDFTGDDQVGDEKGNGDINYYRRIFDKIEGGTADQNDPDVQKMLLYKRYFELIRQGNEGPEFREICKKIDRNKADRLSEMFFHK